MEHTIFFKNLSWHSSGYYYDADGQKHEMTGGADVVRNDEKWTLNGYFDIMYDVPVRLKNFYNIMPTKNPTTFEWESYNLTLGRLKGKFEIIGKNIVSLYVSEDGLFTGSETLIKIDDHTYKSIGVTFFFYKKKSAWDAIYKAIE